MSYLIFTIVGVAALVVLVLFFRYFMLGAGGLFAWANHAGLKGIALFAGCWILFSPLMVIGSVLYGYHLAHSE